MLHLLLSTILFTVLPVFINGQYTPQTYPDPRADPVACKIPLPGQVCDPSEILTLPERTSLSETIQKLQQITANIHNSSPNCAGSQNANLYIMVALVDKLGTLPFEAVSIEKFTNLLRSKYLNYQDVGLCDTLVLIVNSKTDRQVFTVAGRDAKLSREVLQTAFHKNVAQFRGGNYALGLEGMVQLIVSAYNSAHIVQVPSPTPTTEGAVQLPSVSFREQTANALGGSLPSLGQFITHGVRQKPESKPSEKFNLDAIPQDDRLWVEILLKATARCGYDSSKITEYTRAIVEEAMSLSLKLISDTRYSKIEEHAHESEGSNGSPTRDSAWESVKSEIDELYAKYGSQFPRRANQCPAQNGGDNTASSNEAS